MGKTYPRLQFAAGALLATALTPKVGATGPILTSAIKTVLTATDTKAKAQGAAAAQTPDSQVSRALPSPLDSPPFPSSDWLGAFVIGEPDSTPNYPLQNALFGHKLDKDRLKVYGYIDASYNFSTSKTSNFPLSYDVVPNHFELDQAVLRFERVPDTVSTSRSDWGFRSTVLYGEDYRFTIAKGYFSNQLLKRNDLYGFDPVEMYGVLYLPHIGQGTVLQVGRYISPPDIEAQLSIGNYMFTHSIMFGVDPYTFTGVNATVRLSKYWDVLAGFHFGNDMAPWSDSAALNGELLARWVSHNNNDSIWGGINSLGDGKTRDQHDNLQHLVATWQHRFDAKWHMMTEMYYEFQYDPNKGGTVIQGPSEPYIGSGAGPVLSGRADATGIVNYLQYKVSPKDYISYRTDYLNDPRGWRYGFNTAYSSFTLGYCRYLTPTTMVRPEVRYEHAWADGVTPYDGGTRRDQWTLAADVIVRF